MHVHTNLTTHQQVGTFALEKVEERLRLTDMTVYRARCNAKRTKQKSRILGLGTGTSINYVTCTLCQYVIFPYADSLDARKRRDLCWFIFALGAYRERKTNWVTIKTSLVLEPLPPANKREPFYR